MPIHFGASHLALSAPCRLIYIPCLPPVPLSSVCIIPNIMSTPKPQLAFAGLGAMGSGMVAALLKQEYPVQVYDVYAPSVQKAVALGGVEKATPAQVVAGADVVLLMVVNAAQVDDFLFKNGAADALKSGAAIIVFSTVAPSYVRDLEQRLDALGKDNKLLDAPVSGGVLKAAAGSLSIMVSGRPAALEQCWSVLQALTINLVPGEGKLFKAGEKIGLAGDFKMVNQLLAAVHIGSAAEAMALAATAGVKPSQVYEIVKQSTGNSWMFENRVPWMLEDNGLPKSAMTIINKDIGIVMDDARSLSFRAPLASVAEQVYTAGIGAGLGSEDDSNITKFWERFGGKAVAVSRNAAELESTDTSAVEIQEGEKVKQVLVLGLGKIGTPMALQIGQAGIKTVGCLRGSTNFVKGGGEVARNLVQAAKESDVVLLVVKDEAQVLECLFGETGVAESLPAGAIVVIASTIAPSAVVAISDRLAALPTKIALVDAPISGGVARAAKGDLTIMASGPKAALSKVWPVLKAMSARQGKQQLHHVAGGVGKGMMIKLVNQLLVGIHVVSTAEALAFAARKEMDLRALYDVIETAAGGSWCWNDRAPRMLNATSGSSSPHTNVLKDLEVITKEAKALHVPVFFGAAAQQIYTEARNSGYGGDDWGIVKLWEVAGLDVKRP